MLFRPLGHPSVDRSRPPVRCASPSCAERFHNVGTYRVVAQRPEPRTIPRLTCDVLRPDGSVWAVPLARSTPCRAVVRGRTATPRPIPRESPCSAVHAATTVCSLTAALWLDLRRACRTPMRFRHDLYLRHWLFRPLSYLDPKAKHQSSALGSNVITSATRCILGMPT
jgi:hypothetical protein